MPASRGQPGDRHGGPPSIARDVWRARLRPGRIGLAANTYWFTCTTVAGGKPLKYVEEAWLYAPMFVL